MPVSRQTAEGLAREVAAIYAESERLMLERIARNLAQGIDGPAWAEKKLAQMAAMRLQMQTLVADLNRRAATGVETALTQAYERGGLAALAELGLGVVEPLAGAGRLQAMMTELITDLQAANLRILRSTDDLYRSVIARAGSQVLTGTQTRLGAAQSALDDFAKHGITGFVDAAGRAWSLESYAEMAMRAGVTRAAVAGHSAQLLEHGMDLVIVSADGSPCPVCVDWEGEVLSISGDDPEYRALSDAEAAGLFHPNCVIGSTRVSGPDICAADSRWYQGEIVVVRIASGDELSVTPNHPILTRPGWVPANALNEGMEVIRYLGQERMHFVMRPDDVQMPALIEEIPSALLKACPVVSVSVPASSEQFHGDGGSHGEIHVVYPYGFLRDKIIAAVDEPAPQCCLCPVKFGDSLDTECTFAAVCLGALHAPDGVMGGRGKIASLLSGHASKASTHSLATREARVAVGSHAGGKWSLLNTDGGGGFCLGDLTGEVALDRVVKIKRRNFAGHVYNLQTVGGWYAGNTIVTHNCRHTVSAYQEGITRDYPEKSDSEREAEAELYEQSQQQRYLERQVRESKRMEAVALDPAAAAKAQARVREYQARLRELTADSGLPRQYAREQIGKAH